ncbi:MAG: hypothetical protein ACE5FO_10670 [Parvularculaceae bacterium]
MDAVGVFSLLLGFGYFYVTLLMFSITVTNGCSYADAMLSGWFDNRALLQVLGSTILLIAVIFVIRTFALQSLRKNLVETVAQGAFIAGLVLTFGAQKAQLLPYGFPRESFYDAFVETVYGPHFRLLEERQSIDFEWPYDYPEPPLHPYDVPLPSNSELFPNEESPYWRELNAAKQCAADYAAAEKAYHEWREGFEAWREENRWRP